MWILFLYIFQKTNNRCFGDFRELSFLTLLALSKEENPLDGPGLSEAQEKKCIRCQQFKLGCVWIEVLFLVAKPIIKDTVNDAYYILK